MILHALSQIKVNCTFPIKTQDKQFLRCKIVNNLYQSFFPCVLSAQKDRLFERIISKETVLLSYTLNICFELEIRKLN